jgi:hypothetical protein
MDTAQNVTHPHEGETVRAETPGQEERQDRGARARTFVNGRSSSVMRSKREDV